MHQGDFSLSNIGLTIPSGDYGILMGATGSGKTTLLEAICGLRRISSGKILLDNQNVAGLPPSARQIGYVPQDTVLFPTMRIDHQIEFGMGVRKIKPDIRAQRVNELAELLDIMPLLRRYPPGLSGGEKQRVALARALSFKPRLLCLDEPLSALDDSTRQRLAQLLQAVHHKEQVTVLHITHNQVEAEELGTIRFQLENGCINQL